MDADYTATANFAISSYTISGRITLAGDGFADVNLVGLGVISDANGDYSNTIDAGWNGTVTPTKVGYTFWPIQRTYTDVNTNQSSEDYIGLPLDNFNDNRRGAMWRLFVEGYDNTWVVEDVNRLNVRATGDVNNSIAFYISNGWSFDLNEDFAVEIDFLYSGISDRDGWAELAVEDNDSYVSISAGSDGNQPYYYYEAVVDGNIVFEKESRASDDGTLYITYEADSNNLYLSHTGYGDANSYLWQTVSNPLKVVWTDDVKVNVGGGSEIVKLEAGQAYLDNFEMRNAGLLSWPPATDVDGNGFIEWFDLNILCENWLGTGPGDIDDDGTVNFTDFAEFGLTW